MFHDEEEVQLKKINGVKRLWNVSLLFVVNGRYIYAGEMQCDTVCAVSPVSRLSSTAIPLPPPPPLPQPSAIPGSSGHRIDSDDNQTHDHITSLKLNHHHH